MRAGYQCGETQPALDFNHKPDRALTVEIEISLPLAGGRFLRSLSAACFLAP
jgi:hypothetical protein